MKIHNLLKNTKDLPVVADGQYNTHQESNDVNLIFRILTQHGDGTWEFVLGYGRGFYIHEENLWYAYFDDHKARVSDFFSETGGQSKDSKENLKMLGCPNELLEQLNPVPQNWAYQDIEDGQFFTTEIIGWYELPTYEEFMKNE